MLGATRFPAARVMALAYGIQCAFLGIMHGYLEILHGRTPTGGLVIDANSSVINSFFTGMEPALTVFSNFLLTGIFAVVSGIAILVVSTMIAETKYSGAALFGLSALLLFSGGGFTPIPFGILAGICCIGLEVMSGRKEPKKPSRLRLLVAKPWLVLLCISLVWYFYLDFFGFMLRMPTTALGLIGLLVCVLAVVAGLVRDSLRGPVLGI